MVQSLNYLKETPSQTAGPYVHIGLAPGAAGFSLYERELGTDIAGPHAKGERIKVEGLVIDGTGSPIKDVLLEVWQANSQGIYAHPEGARGQPNPANHKVEEGFRGWGRVITDFQTGLWSFNTIKPGATPARQPNVSGAQWQAPHINLWLVARGINIGLQTRIYFADEDNATDPVLNLIEWERRRQTLIAKKLGAGHYQFTIKIQGEDETVFFDV